MPRPSATEYLSRTVLGECLRKERIDGYRLPLRMLARLFGAQLPRARFQRVPRMLLTPQQCATFLDRETGQMILTREGKPPMRLRRLEYWRELPVWRTWCSVVTAKRFCEALPSINFDHLGTATVRKADMARALALMVLLAAACCSDVQAQDVTQRQREPAAHAKQAGESHATKTRRGVTNVFATFIALAFMIVVASVVIGVLRTLGGFIFNRAPRPAVSPVVVIAGAPSARPLSWWRSMLVDWLSGNGSGRR